MATYTMLDRGMMLRDLQAQTLDGRSVCASDFRGRRNLVLIFPGAEAEESILLNELKQRTADLQQEEAVVLVGSDAPADIRSHYGALSPAGRIAALYVTDRYGEIYYSARCEVGGALPSAAEVLGWLEFINSQCPE